MSCLRGIFGAERAERDKRVESRGGAPQVVVKFLHSYIKKRVQLLHTCKKSCTFAANYK